MGRSGKTAEEKKAAIFRERALKLAASTEEAGEGAGVVVFALGGQRYALEFSCVKEVLPPGEITPLPCTPAFLSGVINLRGRIVPVLDLKTVFKIPGGSPARPGVLIMTDGEGVTGLLVDEIEGIAAIRAEDLQPPLPAAAGGASLYAAGIYGGDLTVLDGEKILKDRGLIVDEEP